MATLEIRKETAKVWKHVPSDDLPYIVSKLYIKSEGDNIRVVELGGSQRGVYNFADVSVFDIGGTAETFSSASDLMQRLEALGYVGFFYDGEVSPSLLISSDVGNAITLGSDGKLYVTVSGGGAVDSVNGQTGIVVLDADDISDSLTTNKFVTSAEKTTWNGKQDTLGFTPENVANKENTTLDTSTTKYPTNRLVKEVTDSKQNTLVSGTNIKTINGNSILGSGDLAISGKQYTFNTTVSQSFGDSITVGQNSTGDNSYIKLICSLYGTTNTNRAVAGRGIWEAIRLHNANVNPTTGAFSVVMAGFNDVRRGGNAVKTLSKIEQGYRGIIVNQFMRTSLAANTVSASLTRSGSWSQFFADTVGGKYNNGSFSSTSGNYIEYSFSDNNVTVGMIGGDGVSQIYGNFDVYIDGVLQGSYSVNNKTDGISDGSNNNQRSPYILFFNGLADGNHTIRITLTNSLPVPVDYFGHLKDPNLCTPILLMEAPKMNATGYAIAPANATDAIIDELNVLINSVANEFSSEFPIIVAKTNDWYNVATGLDTDNIHPNNLGHRQIYQSAYEALREVILVQIPVSTNLLLSNNSWTGTNDFTQRVKTSSGFQTTGALTSPTGVGVEIEYNSSEGYVTSYNRSSSSWVNLNIRGAILKFLSGGTQRMEVNTNGLKLNTLPTYADDATAGAGGLTSGQLYKTATGEVRVKL